MEIEATFEKNLQILKNVRSIILDVKVLLVCFDLFLLLYPFDAASYRKSRAGID